MLSIKESTRQYQINGSVLQRWNRWYFKTRLLKYFSPIDAIDMNPSEDAQQLRKQLKAVQAELEQQKLKNLALETLISVAEKELKIDIRKKPGSKPSKS
jgi:transposase